MRKNGNRQYALFSVVAKLFIDTLSKRNHTYMLSVSFLLVNHFLQYNYYIPKFAMVLRKLHSAPGA